MADLLTRIQEVLSWSALGPAAFADEIAVGRPVISHILSARNKASLEVVQKILARFPEVSPLWLLSGEGSMLMKLGENFGSEMEKKEQPAPNNDKEIRSETEQMEAEVQKPEVAKQAPAKVSSVSGRVLLKVVLLYSDGSFESFDPS